MEIANLEMNVLEATVTQRDVVAFQELADLELLMLGSGTGEISLG